MCKYDFTKLTVSMCLTSPAKVSFMNKVSFILFQRCRVLLYVS